MSNDTTIPTGDVKLSDGRRLRRKGRMPFPSPYMVASGEWRHRPTNLVVMADLYVDDPLRSRHVSLSYADRRDPTDADVAAVALAFLKRAEAVHRVDGGARALVVHLFDKEYVARVMARSMPYVRRFVRAWVPDGADPTGGGS